MMKSWYVASPERRKMSKPWLYCASERGFPGVADVDVAAALRLLFREARVAMAVWR